MMGNHSEINSTKLGRRIRLLCGLLCVVLVLALAGYAFYVTAENMAALNAELEALKNSYGEASQEINDLKADNAAAKQEISSLKSDNETLQAELDGLKGDNDEAQKEIENLRAQIEELQKSTAIPKIKIYIDQGHNPTGYHNSGAVGNGLFEQEITYNIGILLAEMLREDGRFEVCLSRPRADTVLGKDNSSSLDARIKGAKDFGADYFISLHVNFHSDASADGVEVYVAEAGGRSYSFGSSLLDGIIESTKLSDRGMKIDSELRVLKNATMPATLLEMGFISNSSDAALLSESPELFATGIFGGILSYFNLT